MAQQAPILNAAVIHAAAPVVYQEAMGITGVTLPADPIQLQPTYAGALAAFEALPQVRVLFDNGAGRLRRRATRSPASSSRGRASRSRAPRARSWYMGPGGTLADSQPAQAGSDAFTWNAHARPLTDFTGDTAAGTGGLWTATPSVPVGSAACGQRRLVRHQPAQRQHDGDRRRRRARLGALLHAQRRPSGHDQRGPARRQGDVRAERLAASQRAQARRPPKSTPLEPVLSLRSVRRVADAGGSVRGGRRSRSTTRDTRTGPARASGSRSPRRTATSRSGRSARRNPSGTASVAIARPSRCRRASCCPVVPGVSVPTALPPCPGLRDEPCRDYQPLAN